MITGHSRTAIFAGGKLKVGQVISSTDKLAGEATSRPIHYQVALYTLYHSLGILADRTTSMTPPVVLNICRSREDYSELV